MRKLLFVHDHPFYEDTDGIVYTGGSFPKSLWNNYLLNFDGITVYGRNSKSLKSRNGVSSTEGVSFYLTDKYSSVSNLFKNLKVIEKELEVLIKNSDVVLVRLPSVLGFIAGNVASKHNKPLWVEQVGNAKEALDNYGTLLGKIAAPMFEYQNRKIVRKANFVSYVTENKLQNDYPTKRGVLTVGLSDVIIKNILKEEDLGKERFYFDTLRIGLIGGFDAKYKGQDILLKAIALLEENIRKNINISLVGKGDYSWVIEEAETLSLVDNIEFIGSLESGEEINEFLKTLDLYIQPSLTEGMPRATIEAMAMGCPVIGSNVGGIPDIVTKLFLHEKGDINKLAKDIRYLYLNREILREEASLSLNKATPYISESLEQKRKNFYAEMNQEIKIEYK